MREICNALYDILIILKKIFIIDVNAESAFVIDLNSRLCFYKSQLSLFTIIFNLMLTCQHKIHNGVAMA